MVLYSDNKLLDVLVVAGVAGLLNLPVTYRLTEAVIPGNVILNTAGQPTLAGVAIHAAVLGLLLLIFVQRLRRNNTGSTVVLEKQE